jgi:hypothetical protein
VLTFERGGLENLWRRPSQYRPVPGSHSPSTVPGPRASFRPLVSLRLPARLGPNLGVVLTAAMARDGTIPPDIGAVLPHHGVGVTHIKWHRAEPSVAR